MARAPTEHDAAQQDTAPHAAQPHDTAPHDAPQHDTAPHDAPQHGYTARKGEHVARLRRIEGQIRGLQRMVDEDQYCIDILTQVSAASRALKAFSLQLLDEHLNHCVLHAAEHGGQEAAIKVREASAAVARLVRS